MLGFHILNSDRTKNLKRKTKLNPSRHADRKIIQLEGFVMLHLTSQHIYIIFDLHTTSTTTILDNDRRTLHKNGARYQELHQ